MLSSTSRLLFLFFAWICFVSVAAQAQDDSSLTGDAFVDADYLETKRWNDPCYGSSLNNPKDMVRTDFPAKGILAKWTHPDGYEFSLSVYASFQSKQQERLSMQDVISSLNTQQKSYAARCMPMESFDKQFIVGDKHPTMLSYSTIQTLSPNGKVNPTPIQICWAAVTMRKHLYLLIKMRCPLPADDDTSSAHITKEANRRLEAMVRSIKVIPEDTLVKARQMQFKRGFDFINALDIPAQCAMIPKDRWFLLFNKDNQKIGHARIRTLLCDKKTKPSKDNLGMTLDTLGHRGIAVSCQIHVDQHDEISIQFSDFDSKFETWRTLTTSRKTSNPVTSEEFGFVNLNYYQGQDVLTIEKRGEDIHSPFTHQEQDSNSTFQSPVELHLRDLALPPLKTIPRAPQTYIWLFPSLLPRDKPMSCALFAWSGAKSVPGPCLWQNLPQQDGSRLVKFRPAMDLPATIYTFSAEGKLTCIRYHSGIEMRQVTREQVLQTLAPTQPSNIR